MYVKTLFQRRDDKMEVSMAVPPSFAQVGLTEPLLEEHDERETNAQRGTTTHKEPSMHTFCRLNHQAHPGFLESARDFMQANYGHALHSHRMVTVLMMAVGLIISLVCLWVGVR